MGRDPQELEMPFREGSEGESRSTFGRIAKNVGWVAGSRGFNLTLSVVYLAFTARALGPEKFGVFALILTYAQLIANFVQFQSWKGIIRYGAMHLTSGRHDRLKRLFGFTAALDFGSAIVGALIAILCVPLVGPLLHWNPDEQFAAAAFAGVLLLTTGATPSGILRLCNRFDLAAFCEATGPLIRLAGAIIGWMMGAGPMKYVSRKMLRWFGGVFLTLSAVFAFAAAATISASAGLLLILAACAAVAVGVRMNSGPIAATAEMALATYATLIGVLRAMRGQTVVTWAPAKSR